MFLGAILASALATTLTVDFTPGGQAVSGDGFVRLIMEDFDTHPLTGEPYVSTWYKITVQMFDTDGEWLEQDTYFVLKTSARPLRPGNWFQRGDNGPGDIDSVDFYIEPIWQDSSGDHGGTWEDMFTRTWSEGDQIVGKTKVDGEGTPKLKMKIT